MKGDVLCRLTYVLITSFGVHLSHSHPPAHKDYYSLLTLEYHVVEIILVDTIMLYISCLNLVLDWL